MYEALRYIEKNSVAVSSEIIPIENAYGRISASSLFATVALPSFNNSAMDGFALKGDHKTYTIVGKILAGDRHTYQLQDGECIKILTGARVPQDVDSIIPQENVTIDEKHITINKPVPYGANIRHKGEDIDIDQPIVRQGDVITSAHIGLFASQGITHIDVYRPLRVAVFGSGSELKLHFEKIDEAEIFNSNTPYLLSRAQELGTQTRFIGKSDDSVESLKKLITSALDCDLIVTSGGVSVGEADFTKQAFTELGMEIYFTKVLVKPGKPTTFGKIGDTAVLNLPGNPLASALNFEIFGKFLINKLSGKAHIYPNYIQSKLSKELSSPRPVANIIPGTFNGQTFTPANQYAPGMVNVLNHCNALIVMAEETNKIEKEESVKVLPIQWEFFTKEFREFMS